MKLKSETREHEGKIFLQLTPVGQTCEGLTPNDDAVSRRSNTAVAA
jgi:hypothetical protein